MNAKIKVNLNAILKGHRASVYSLAKGNGAHRFFSADGNGWIVEWNLEQGENGKLIAQMQQPVYSIWYSETGNFIWAGTTSGEIARIDLAGNARMFKAHEGAVYGFTPAENNSFFSYGADGVVIHWNEEAAVLNKFTVLPRAIRSLLNLDHQLLLGFAGGKLITCNKDGSHPHELSTFNGTLFSLEPAPAPKTFYAAGRDAHLYRLAASDRLIETDKAIPAHLQSIHSLKTNGKGLLASSSMDKTIKIWDAHTLELLKVIDKAKYGLHSSSVNHLLWLDEHTLVSASDDRQIGVFEIETSF